MDAEGRSHWPRSDSLFHSAEKVTRQGQAKESLENKDAFCLIRHKKVEPKEDG